VGLASEATFIRKSLTIQNFFPAKAACGAAQRGERTHGIMKDGWVAVRAANTLTPRLRSSSTGGSEDGTGGTSVAQSSRPTEA